jgi:hypothetical protein
MMRYRTSQGGKVGPVGTFFISVLLVFLFGASLFFTSVGWSPHSAGGVRWVAWTILVVTRTVPTVVNWCLDCQKP